MSIVGGVGASQTVGPASGGKTTVLNNIGTAAAQVIAANPSRRKITFHNPGTVNVYVAMLVNAQGAAFTPTLAALGGTFLIYPGNTLPFDGEVQVAWQALAASGSTNPLTIMESNV
jgi:hypothetical protein